MATHQSAFLKGRRFPAERIPHAMWLAEPGTDAAVSIWRDGAMFDMGDRRFFGMMGSEYAGSQVVPIAGMHGVGMMQGYTGSGMWNGPWSGPTWDVSQMPMFYLQRMGAMRRIDAGAQLRPHRAIRLCARHRDPYRNRRAACVCRHVYPSVVYGAVPKRPPAHLVCVSQRTLRPGRLAIRHDNDGLPIVDRGTPASVFEVTKRDCETVEQGCRTVR